MKYLMILFLIVLSACSKINEPTPDPDLTPSEPPSYYNPDLEATVMTINSIIGNQMYIVASIINATTGENAEYLYPGYLGSIYTIPANRIDSITIKPNGDLPSFKIGGWNLGVDVSKPDIEEKVTSFHFPIYNRLTAQYAMKGFNKNFRNGPEFKFTADAIILRDRYVTETYIITLMQQQPN